MAAEQSPNQHPQPIQLHDLDPNEPFVADDGTLVTEERTMEIGKLFRPPEDVNIRDVFRAFGIGKDEVETMDRTEIIKWTAVVAATAACRVSYYKEGTSNPKTSFLKARSMNALYVAAGEYPDPDITLTRYLQDFAIHARGLQADYKAGLIELESPSADEFLHHALQGFVPGQDRAGPAPTETSS